jgi:hypothetical protein
MFLVEDQIVGELDWGLAGSNPFSASIQRLDSMKSRGARTILCTFP